MGLRLTSWLCYMTPDEYKFGPKDLASVQHSLRFCSSSCPASHLWPQHLLEMSRQLSDLILQIQYADHCKHVKQRVGNMVRIGYKRKQFSLKMCLFLCHTQTITRFWPFITQKLPLICLKAVNSIFCYLKPKTFNYTVCIIGTPEERREKWREINKKEWKKKEKMIPESRGKIQILKLKEPTKYKVRSFEKKTHIWHSIKKL